MLQAIGNSCAEVSKTMSETTNWAGKARPQRKVVVVDDDAACGRILQEGLALEGYAVKTTTQSIRAYDLVCDFRPDLVILDWMMPYLQGDDIARLLRMNQDTAAIPIIFMTGNALSVLYSRLPRDMQDIPCLLKPFRFDALFETVEREMRVHRLTT
jgi:DNA-binding response OmpR family regulator